MVAQTEWVVGNFYRNIKRVPEDKLNWKVLDTGRSVLDQVQEVAMSPAWSTPLLTGESTGDWDPTRFEAAKVEMATWTTLEKCEEVHMSNLAKLFEAMRAVKDEDLEKTVRVAFAPEPVPIASILTFHYWNVVYHQGQILFIQTLYGDNDMVF